MSILALLAAAAPKVTTLIALWMGIGASTGILALQDSNPFDSTSLLNYGFAGVVAFAFILVVWAIASGRITTTKLDNMLTQGAEREAKLIELVQQGQQERMAQRDRDSEFRKQLMAQNQELLNILRDRS